MQNIRLIKRKDVENPQEPEVEKSVAAKPAAKTTVEVVKAWVNEHKQEPRSSARKMFDALFAQ